MAAFGLLIFALALPMQANDLAQKVLGNVVTINKEAGIPTLLPQGSKSSIGNSSSANAPIGDDSGPLSIGNIIDATNGERIKAGLPPLKANIQLEQSAKLKVDDMITNQYFEHTSPSGKTVSDLANEVGYSYVVLGENLALGDFASADDLLQAWMNSPGHRANILNKSYEDIGVYAAQGTYQGQTVWFAVQHFGTERGVCPIVDTTLKNGIDTLNATIKQEETTIDALRTQIEDPNHAQNQAYTNLISQFNGLVATYNTNITISQEDTSQYNQQVIAFNKCLSQYQVAAPAVE